MFVVTSAGNILVNVFVRGVGRELGMVIWIGVSVWSDDNLGASDSEGD